MSVQNFRYSHLKNLMSNATGYLFSLSCSVSLFLFGGHSTSIDEETYLASLRAFLRGSNALDTSKLAEGAFLAMPNKDGLPSSFYGFGTVLVNLPFYAIGKLVSIAFASEQREQIIRLFFFSANSFYFGLITAVLYLISKLLGCSERMAITGALCYAFCTFALWSAGTGFSEIPTSLFLLLSCYFLFVKPTSAYMYLSGLSLGVAVLVRASAILFIAPLLLFLIHKNLHNKCQQRILFWVLGGFLPGSVFLGVNYWKFGSVFSSGYPQLKYDTPIYEGLFGLFLSLGKGLIWFAPITLIALLNTRTFLAKNKSVGSLLVSCVSINALFFARFEVWSGDDAFGPRYMMIVLPQIVVFAFIGMDVNRWRRNRLFVFGGSIPAFLGALLYVNAINWMRVNDLIAYTGPSSFALDGGNDWSAIRRLTIFVPSKSQLITYIENLPLAVYNSFDRILHARESINFSVNNGEQLSWYMKSTRLDIWWLYWLESSAPRAFLILPLILVLVIVISLLKLRIFYNKQDTAL
jgi:hypothetical protein